MLSDPSNTPAIDTLFARLASVLRVTNVCDKDVVPMLAAVACTVTPFCTIGTSSLPDRGVVAAGN